MILGILKTMAYISQVMKSLIIHTQDPSTSFLSQIYAPLTNKTLVKGGITKSELLKLIKCYDRVIMLGHGSPYGLLNRGQFPDAGLYIIDDSMILSLKNKINSVFIWCNADQFVQRHGLTGLNCGMFISKAGEAEYYGFDNMDWDLVDQSNKKFVSVVSQYINEPLDVLYKKLVHEYGLLARSNPIARFNLERLFLTYAGTIKNPNKVFVMGK